MSSDLGTSRAPVTPEVPPATRASSPGWRDARLWVGVVIVAVSVVAGSRLLAAADDTVPVWAVAADVGPGDRVDPDDLVAQRVRFTDAAAQGRYFTVDDELPAELRTTRGLGAGELLPRAALGGSGEAGTVEVPLAVDPTRVPPSVGAGSVVDVYLVAPLRTASGRRPGPVEPAAPALAEATVVDAPVLAETFGASGQRQVVVAVPDVDARRFFALLAALEDPVVSVVARG